MMQTNWKRNVLAISAVTAALALTGCGNAGEDSNAVSRSNTGPASTATAPGDRMTADASKAMNRAGDTATGAANKAGTAAGDAALTAKVKSKLMAEPGIQSLKIDVDTESSKVILKGEVDTAANREKAKQIASSTEGVTEVVDQLQVKSK